MIRKTLLVAGIVATTLSSSLSAGFLQPPSEDWTGPYVGGHAGAAFGSFKKVTPTTPGPVGDGGNVMAGLQGGYNWQHNEWVFGAEADISIIDIAAATPGFGKFLERYMITLRGRAGYDFGSYFVYGTLGLGLTDKKMTRASGVSDRTIQEGVAVGAGVEGTLDTEWFDDDWTTRFEFLYVDCDHDIQVIGATTTSGGSNNYVIRLGLNRRL